MLTNEIFTPREAAKILKVDYRTVLREIERGNLPAKRVGRLFIITDSILKQYLENELPRPLTVSVAIVEKEGDIILVKRKQSEGPLKWQFPSGIVHFNEKPSVRAEITCLRESGIHSIAIRSLGERVHPDTKVKISYWLCGYLSGELYNAEEEENEKVEWVSKDKVLKYFTSDTFPAVKEYLLSKKV